MKKYLFFLIANCLVITCCLGQRAAELENLKRYVPPKNQKFLLTKDSFRLLDTSVVTSEAYYLRPFVEEERKNYKVIKTMTTYTYIRFYLDGRVFFSFSYLNPPNKQELEDTTYGKFGRYIIKDGKLKVELYQDNHDGYAFLYAYAVPDGIQFYKSSSRGWFLRANRRTKDGGYYQKFYFRDLPNSTLR